MAAHKPMSRESLSFQGMLTTFAIMTRRIEYDGWHGFVAEDKGRAAKGSQAARPSASILIAIDRNRDRMRQSVATAVRRRSSLDRPDVQALGSSPNQRVLAVLLTIGFALWYWNFRGAATTKVALN